MAKIRCFHCQTAWELGAAISNRCPHCGWINEIYYDSDEAQRVAEIYNNQQPPLPEPSGVQPLEGITGYSVSFPDQDRLAQVAEQLLNR